MAITPEEEKRIADEMLGVGGPGGYTAPKLDVGAPPKAETQPWYTGWTLPEGTSLPPGWPNDPAPTYALTAADSASLAADKEAAAIVAAMTGGPQGPDVRPEIPGPGPGPGFGTRRGRGPRRRDEIEDREGRRGQGQGQGRGTRGVF